MGQTAGAAKAAPSRTKPVFQWDDPFLLDDQLSEDERLVRDTTRAYAQDKLMPRIIEANRHERFDREIMNEMGALGLLGIHHRGLWVRWRQLRLLWPRRTGDRGGRFRLPLSR